MPSVAELPVTPPVGPIPHVEITDADLAFLEDMIAPHSEPYLHAHPKSQSWRPRDAPLDPLLFAAAAASGPHVTRHHYHHDFFPATLGFGKDQDWSQSQGDEKEENEDECPSRYVSKQAPRSQRLAKERKLDSIARLPATPELGTPALSASSESLDELQLPPRAKPTANFTPPPFDSTNTGVQVQCLSRARIPTPHGPAFLHLYRNNRDSKEHLAIVVDPAQLEKPSHQYVSAIRSRSLDAAWSSAESDTDRIVRGAYVGRLTSTTRIPSSRLPEPFEDAAQVPAPLVRIHSECFTGETIGSMRCDCGEQLDEALRLISLPIPVAGPGNTTVPGRGVIVYMRQEGRGIGLLSKLRAYNLQDMGHDTVTANLMLGHGADERGYEIAGAILRDLGLDGEDGMRLLTNNPEKVRALQDEGVHIVERVGMVPRSWQCRQHDHPHVEGGTQVRAMGVTLLGSGAAHGEDLEKYLRTKIDRMGHMLTVPPPSAY
ncbi:GTP cyclohydrolase II-domain-containing protein [Gautieria morchelliformis]|nr:GTP cyclohydrolase II-domain-containing protein [Gautieria morchelliformis]